MKKEYIYEVENMPQDGAISSSIGFHGTNSKMVGLSDQFRRLKTDLMRGSFSWNRVHALYGTAGIGKTTLSMQIYQDPQIQIVYQRRAWVTVGRVPQPMSQILQGILAQLSVIKQGDEEIIDHCLKERSVGKNCLIVLDDVWEIEVVTFLIHCLPTIKNGYIHVLLTGRYRNWMSDFSLYEVRFLKEKESMDLLCEKVFGDEICPPQLHRAATKIAKLCEGLPLLIVTVADIISKSEQNRDPVYWNAVAEKRNSVFTDAYNRISKVLSPSYDYLPQHLKVPFLFMGVFPRDYNTPISKITIMLTAEGLSDAKGLLEDWEYLRELAINYSLVLCRLKSVHKNSQFHSSYKEFNANEYKTCWLHSSWRHVCRGEASKNKFYHLLSKLNDAEEEVLKGQRGLCIENNILFGIKEFCDSVRLNCASYTRSLLLYGPYHQYPIPIDVGFRLLREIDALTQRFYTFPIEILSLVHLKYLALTCNGELPSTILKLFNLRVLIIHPHMDIIRIRAPSYVPIQVWDMQGLEHIEILGKSLVAPSHVTSLRNLSTLVGVNASICTVLKLSTRIPNIRKLGIQIELMPDNDHNDILRCFGCISTLVSLKTLKISITNPVVKRGHGFPKAPWSLKLPRYLEKLHLSGTGFPWKYMDAIGSLPRLEVLKLRSYAFQGLHWKAYRRSFPRLQFLLIEESDLVQWKRRSKSFPMLSYLGMKHCYRLEEIPKPHIPYSYKRPSWMYVNGYKIIEIELVDCNPLALICVSQFQPDKGVRLDGIASSTFYEKPMTIKFQRYRVTSTSELKRRPL
ncbi:late blight resistance protein R1-A-like isoform X2 [Salvia hispanica]|uniref:late blight resistance protein R1-A-like isoform X2 n=1 Tax=Salvia hispanica TaxID=49212 RepID=UPI00200973A0|nr:late blight resistance protein R1-A-like isoform X2 [Salvia hispanica]